MAGRKHVTVLIPAAGRSERFVQHGYHGSKALLRVEHEGVQRTMLGHVLRTLPDYTRCIVGCRSRDHVGFYAHAIHAVPLVHTSGQADTLRQILEHIGTDYESVCLVVNCDALVPRAHLRALVDLVLYENYGVAALVHRTRDSNCSFVDQIPHPTVFREKEPISEYGMSGAWAVRSPAHLLDALRMSVFNDAVVSGEHYLSTALNRVPGPYVAYQTTPEQIVDWNTPEALEASGARILE